MPGIEQQHDEHDKKEQNKKDAIKKEQAAESMKTRCKTCFKETSPNPKCFGHGGGGGSGGGDSGEKGSKSDGQTQANISGQIIDPAVQVANATTQTIEVGDLNVSQQQSQLTFNPEIISELLSKKLLLIDNDRDSGILTIKLQCNSNMLSKEQRNELKKFTDVILKELNEFKKEKGISSDHEVNSFFVRIHLPTPSMYDAFIQRLASKNFLPIQNIEQKEKFGYEEGINHFIPSPQLLRVKPAMSKDADLTSVGNFQSEKNNTLQKEEKLSSIRPRSPLDGLKPKGWK